MNVNRRVNAVERLKQQSDGLRGTIAEELAGELPGFSADNVRLLKHHGVFQQDDRSERRRHREQGGERQYEFMVRVRATGGKLSAQQFRAILETASDCAQGDVRFTSRQSVQIHGIQKAQLQTTMRRIAAAGLTTLATAGDLNCNVMCVPVTPKDVALHAQLQAAAELIDDSLMPHPGAYEEIWLDSQPAAGVREACPTAAWPPWYRETLLPHKFKVALGIPEDNCADIFSQDVGLLADISAGRVIGFNVLVGGSMGTIMGVRGRFPALAQPLAYIPYDELRPVLGAIVRTYSRLGDRTDRGKARLKYVIHRWGIPAFRQHVETDLGRPLEPPRSWEVVGCKHHLGWQAKNDGNWCFGIHVEQGVLRDTNTVCLKSVLLQLSQLLPHSDVQLTPQQNIVFNHITPPQRHEVERLLATHHVPSLESLSNVRRLAMACPGLPYCPSAITTSDRLLSHVLPALEAEMTQLGLTEEHVILRVTGCAFGCTRSYLADIAVVGRTLDPDSGQERFAIFLGGDGVGSRLSTLYQDFVPAELVVPTLLPLLREYQQFRDENESLGDFLHRRVCTSTTHSP